MTQESVESGSRRAMAEDEMCRPRPVAALTSPIARPAPGISAFTRVDFPTPEWPTKTLRCSRSRSAQRIQIGARKGHLHWDPERLVLRDEFVGCRQIGLGEAEQRPECRRRSQQPAAGRSSRRVAADLASAVTITSWSALATIGRSYGSSSSAVRRKHGFALLDLDDARECALGAGCIADDPDPITNDDARPAELPCLGGGHCPGQRSGVG